LHNSSQIFSKQTRNFNIICFCVGGHVSLGSQNASLTSGHSDLSLVVFFFFPIKTECKNIAQLESIIVHL